MAGKLSDIDISNLRFYAELFRENGWETNHIANGVFPVTLEEIATRYISLDALARELREALQERMDLWSSKDATSTSKRAGERRAQSWDRATKALARAKEIIPE